MQEVLGQGALHEQGLGGVALVGVDHQHPIGLQARLDQTEVLIGEEQARSGGP